MDTTLINPQDYVSWNVFIYVASGMAVAVIALSLYIKKLHKESREVGNQVLTVVLNNTNAVKSFRREQKDSTEKILAAMPDKKPVKRK